VDYKGLKSAGYRRINMDEKVKFQQEKIYSKNLQFFKKVLSFHKGVKNSLIDM
jgi:hypothetical protein